MNEAMAFRVDREAAMLDIIDGILYDTPPIGSTRLNLRLGTVVVLVP